MTHPARLAAIAAALALAACNGTGDDAASGDAGPDVASAESKAEDWGKDACSTYPVGAVAKAAGIDLVTAESHNSTPVEGVNVSTCNYTSSDGKQIVGVTLRHDLEGGRTIEGEISGLQGMPDLTGPTEVIAMPAGQAVWQPKLRTLTWIPEANRLIAVTPWGLNPLGESDPADEMKARAVKIATGIGS